MQKCLDPSRTPEFYCWIAHWNTKKVQRHRWCWVNRRRFFPSAFVDIFLFFLVVIVFAFLIWFDLDLIFEKINTGESNANIEIMKDSDWDDILRLEEEYIQKISMEIINV